MWENLKFLSFKGINPKPFTPTLHPSCITTLFPIIAFLIVTFKPIRQFFPICTSCSIIVLLPTWVLDPILTFFPIKIFFPNVTEESFEDIFFDSTSDLSG